MNTAKKRGPRKNLQQNEEKYSFIFENASTPMALVQEDGTLLLINGALEKLCGYSRKELEKKQTWWKLALEGTLKKLDTPESGLAGISNINMINYEFQLKSKDGKFKNIFLGINVISGSPWQIASFLDISSVRYVGKALQKSDEQFQELMRNIPGIVYLCCYDELWTMHYLVNEIEHISGYPASDFINNNVRSYASIIHPDDLELVEEAVSKGVEANKPYEMEYRIIKKNGEIAWVYEKGQKIYKKNDTVWLNGIIFDVTERKQLQLALDIAAEEWRVTFDAIPNPVFLLNRECRIMKCNKAAEKFFELSKNEIIGRLYYELFYSLDKPPADDPYLKMLKTGETQSKVERFDEKTVEITMSPILDPNGNIYGSVLVMVDITKLKETEAELTEKNKQLQDIFHTAPVGIGVVSGGRIIKANAQSCRLTGFSPKELIGKDVSTFHETEAECDRVKKYYTRLKKNEVSTVATKLIRKDGQIMDALLRFSPTPGRSGYTWTMWDMNTQEALTPPQ
ncbi:MAG: PAS domain S-box protein [Victivallales bacterium]|nr:PAS domain S-box protein [Victivallales bacterium]